MPAQALGDVTVQVHTPGGISDNYNMVVQPTAPAVFLAGVAGPQTNLPTVIRAQNNLAGDGFESDSSQRYAGHLSHRLRQHESSDSRWHCRLRPTRWRMAVIGPQVALGNTNLPVVFGGMTPGQVGLCQFNVTVPTSTPTGLGMPLTIAQGSMAQTLKLRVVD